MEKFSINTLGRLDERAEAANLTHPFKFLNDAGRSQKIFEQYGSGKSLARLREIAKAYGMLSNFSHEESLLTVCADSGGVFQRLNSGGFKLW